MKAELLFKLRSRAQEVFILSSRKAEDDHCPTSLLLCGSYLSLGTTLRVPVSSHRLKAKCLPCLRGIRCETQYVACLFFFFFSCLCLLLVL